MTAKKPSPRLSRRAFLGALGLGSAAALAPGAARALDKGTVKAADSGKQLATLIDIERCIGCEECVFACREVNGHKFPEPKKPFPEMVPPGRARPEDFSDRRDLTDRLTPYNWLYIQRAEAEHAGEHHFLNIPRRCLHCTNPPCANLCPFGAARKLENGIVRIDDGVCLGGAKCRKVCPWHIPQRQSGVGLYLKMMPRFAGNGVMYKCDRCFDRVAEGRLPACIEICPAQVQKIGPRGEIVAQAKKLAKERGAYLYGLDDNGGTNTVYLSPVPFDKLDAAVVKGKGRPGLDRKENAMAREENLAWAVFAAPLAGLAAGVLGLAKGRKTNSAKETGHERG